MSKYFKPSEMACKCGCGKSYMDNDIYTYLDIAREFADVPFVINSGYRCEKHNKAVGGKETSSHLKGLAVDIKATTSRDRAKIIHGLVLAGFTRIGIGREFVHADMDMDKSQDVMWLY